MSAWESVLRVLRNAPGGGAAAYGAWRFAVWAADTQLPAPFLCLSPHYVFQWPAAGVSMCLSGGTSHVCTVVITTRDGERCRMSWTPKCDSVTPEWFDTLRTALIPAESPSTWEQLQDTVTSHPHAPAILGLLRSARRMDMLVPRFFGEPTHAAVVWSSVSVDFTEAGDGRLDVRMQYPSGTYQWKTRNDNRFDFRAPSRAYGHFCRCVPRVPGTWGHLLAALAFTLGCPRQEIHTALGHAASELRFRRAPAPSEHEFSKSRCVLRWPNGSQLIVTPEAFDFRTPGGGGICCGGLIPGADWYTAVCRFLAPAPAPRLRVYISGPITLGPREQNIAQADRAARKLMDAGFAPFNPMLSALSQACHDVPHDSWIEADLPWVEVSHAVLRLPGESRGADQETAHAEARGIPVFYTLKGLIQWRDKHAQGDAPNALGG